MTMLGLSAAIAVGTRCPMQAMATAIRNNPVCFNMVKPRRIDERW
jgi:hypothetical protein